MQTPTDPGIEAAVTADESTAVEVRTAGGRLTSVDALRGIIMVLMLLDHTRDFFTDIQADPMDPQTSTLPLYFTRWITHFCAPLFVFLAGASAYLMRALGKEPDARSLARFLASRGLFLMLMELTLVRLGIFFGWGLDGMFLQVIWVIGLSMVTLAALVGLGFSPVVIGTVGGFIVLGHNLLDLAAGQPAGSRGQPLPGWVALTLRPGPLSLAEGVRWFVAYPLLPWFGIMCLGYAFGTVLARARPTRIRRTAAVGLAVCVAFLALRSLSVYGDPIPFRARETAAKTVMAFLNCQKYPPSLLYALMTLGPGLLILAALDASQEDGPTSGAGRQGLAGRLRRVLSTLGRVPLFYYVLQWPLLHLLAIAAGLVVGRPAPWTGAPFDVPFPSYSLGFAYAMWLLGVAILYLPCRWYARLRQRRKDLTWLSYL